MKRIEFIRTIAELAGPIGPLGTIEYSDKATADWYNTFNKESIDVMIDLLINPPEEKELGYEIPEYFDVELNNALIAFGKMYTSIFFKKIEHLPELQRLQSDVIYIIGGIRNQEGIPYLVSLLEKDNLSNDGIFELIGAIGQIGGEKSMEILEKMKVMYNNKSPEAVQQIEIWLKYINDKKD